MKCRSIVPLAIIFAASAAVASEGVQTLPIRPNGKIATPHDGKIPQKGEVPDTVAFWWLTKIASDDPEYAEALVKGQTGDGVNATGRIVTHLGESHAQLMAERQDAEMRIACRDDMSQLTSGEAHRLFDLVDEVQVAVDAKYLLISRATIGTDKLRVLLDYLKPGITVQQTPATAVYKDAPSGLAINNLVTFCQVRR